MINRIGFFSIHPAGILVIKRKFIEVARGCVGNFRGQQARVYQHFGYLGCK